MKTDLRHLRAYLRAVEYSLDKPVVVDTPQPVITISRQRGAQGKLIAQKTAEFLTRRSRGKQPWIVIDRSLAQRVMEDHHLTQRIGHLLTEEQTVSIQERLEEMLGLRPSRWTVVEKMVQTIMRLAEIGRVIFVGRAANIITAHLPQACHVRIVGSVECRVQRIMEAMSLTHAEAHTLARKVDQDRARFVSSYFHASVEDPAHYDLTINTDRIPIEKAVLLIAQLLPEPDDSEKGVEPMICRMPVST